MNNIKKFSLDFPVGFNGKNVLLASYNNIIGLVGNICDQKCTIISGNMLNQTSEYSDNYYKTVVSINDLDDLIQGVLYAKYNGNIYSVGTVFSHTERVELFARNDNLLEDLKLGFVEDKYERVTNKIVSRSSIEDIYIESNSILEEVKDNTKNNSL